MYILKNALRNITRTKGRNILIGIIVIIIAVSSCIALSISNSASALVENQMTLNSITATITVDMEKVREKMQSQMQTATETESRPKFQFERPELTVDQIKTYGNSKYVTSFNYSLTTTVNSTIEPYSTSSTDEDSSTSSATVQQRPGGEMGGGRGGFNSGDFSMVGYSGQAAMTDFISGTSTITDGAMFNDDETGNVCVISSEVAILNSLAVGSEITFSNPQNEEETFAMKVVGIYKTTSEDTSNNFITQNAMNPSNKIITSYTALNTIVEASESKAAAETETTEETDEPVRSTALTGNLNSSFTLADETALENFKTDLTTMGMSDEFTVTSNLDTVANTLEPIKNLASFANLFLLLVLIVGGGILVILNMINIRERKYEIGVLTAIGMKKSKVALQFIMELFTVTLASIIIGTGIGAALSVPTATKLLDSQISAQKTSTSQINQNFGGRGGDMPTGQPGGGPTGGMNRPGMMGGMFNQTQNMNYVDQINAVVSLPVLFELLGIGILLTLISGSVALIAISRYSPLKILSSRT